MIPLSETKIPHPPETRGRKAIYPFRNMKKGDQFKMRVSSKEEYRHDQKVVFASARYAGIKVTTFFSPGKKNFGCLVVERL
jgi:hypothetical protein